MKKLEECSIFEIRHDSESIIRFEKNGDIFIHGDLIENDKQVVEGFRNFLKQQGMI